MTKTPIKKKTFTRPGIDSIRNELGLTVTSSENLNVSNADKPMSFIEMPQAFQDALRLPGIPEGYPTICAGWSNTGKSTLVNCLIAGCQKQGILPVMFQTENNFDFRYAQSCGVVAEPVYGKIPVEKVDSETGEIYEDFEDGIITYNGEFLYYNNKILAEMYGCNDYATGTTVKTKRKQAVLEDIAYAINSILDMQDEGKIQQPICFIIDSIGAITSFKSWKSKTGNNMFDAAAISQAFSNILNARIPGSRSVSEKYTNSFFAVNKIWDNSMQAMGMPSYSLKGGKSVYYAARLIIQVGGVAKAGTTRLTATAKGATYNYGMITKVKTVKNQLPEPWSITSESQLACVSSGLWDSNKLDEYKKTHMKDILKEIEERMGNEGSKVSENDVQFTQVEDADGNYE